MGNVGWGLVSNQANTETGGAIGVVADATAALSTGLGVGGTGVINDYQGAPPMPPSIFGFLLLETGLLEYLLQETGTPPTRIQLE